MFFNLFCCNIISTYSISISIHHIFYSIFKFC